MAEKRGSFGASVKYDPLGGTAWTTVVQVGDINGPTMTRGIVDVTTHDSPDNGWREKLGGRPDAGNISFGLQWDPEQDIHAQGTAGILYDFQRNAAGAWRVEAPIASGTVYWDLSGILIGATPALLVEGSLTQEITIAVSGKPALTATFA